MPAAELMRFGLNPASIVWTPGMADWQTAASCPELAHLLGGGYAVDVDVQSAEPGKASAGYGDAANYGGYHDSNPYGAPQSPYGNPAAGGANSPYGNPGYGPYQGGPRIPDPNNPGNWIENPMMPNGGQNQMWSGKSKIVAGLLAIFLGTLGVHYFYCGKVTGGFICLLISLATCGMWGIITLIQGIYMLTMTDQQFDQKYVYTPSAFPIF